MLSPRSPTWYSEYPSSPSLLCMFYKNKIVDPPHDPGSALCVLPREKVVDPRHDPGSPTIPPPLPPTATHLRPREGSVIQSEPTVVNTPLLYDGDNTEKNSPKKRHSNDRWHDFTAPAAFYVRLRDTKQRLVDQWHIPTPAGDGTTFWHVPGVHWLLV